MQNNKYLYMSDKEILNALIEAPKEVNKFIERNPDIYKAIYYLKDMPPDYGNLEPKFYERMMLLSEFAKRLLLYNKVKNQRLYNSGIAALYLVSEMQFFDTERLAVLSLNSNYELIGKEFVAIGTESMCPVSIRAIFMSAILHSAASVIIAHNHPSGNVEPSSKDISITKNIETAGKILNIPLLDHIIIGRGNYYSFHENRGEDIN